MYFKFTVAATGTNMQFSVYSAIDWHNYVVLCLQCHRLAQLCCSVFRMTATGTIMLFCVYGAIDWHNYVVLCLQWQQLVQLCCSVFTVPSTGTIMYFCVYCDNNWHNYVVVCLHHLYHYATPLYILLIWALFWIIELHVELYLLNERLNGQRLNLFWIKMGRFDTVSNTWKICDW